MLAYILRRFAQMIPLIFLISILSFVIIDLPPGDFLNIYVSQLQQAGTEVAEGELAKLRIEYGLDKPFYVRYFRWISNIVLRGDFGQSFQWQKPVIVVIRERIALTMVVSLITMAFVYGVSIPIGIYSATHQYSALDYLLTFFGFFGLATPNFLFAIVLLWVSFFYFGVSITGLFSAQFVDAAWSGAKVWNMLTHMWVPVVVIGTGGTASVIRVMRGCLLDELRKQYVVTARAKGVAEGKLIRKYPVRIALNPIISTIGWLLPAIISGETITSIVLNLPTTGPVFLRALLYQDMYLAGGMVMILAVLTLVGTLISDILLAFVDPRIRYGGKT